MPNLQIKERGLIYDAAGQPVESRIAFFTSLCRLRSGGWISGFQAGTGKHSVDSTIRFSRSADGRTWTPLPPSLSTQIDGVPGSLSAPAMIDLADGRLLLFATWFDRSDPKRPLFDPVTQGILRSKLLLAESINEGETWTPWCVLPTPGLTGCSGTGEMLRWRDGRLAVCFESFRQFDEPQTRHHAAWMMVSGDGGRSFGPPLMVAQDPQHQMYYWDQRLCPSDRDGEFVALFWTHDLPAQRDRNVHLLRAAIGGNGISGADIMESTIPGQIAAPLALPDGRWLAFVVDRRGPCTMTLWQSSDAGATWPEEDRLVIHQHEEQAVVTPGGEAIDFNQYWEEMGKWSFGHPALRSVDDSTVLCAYYAGTPDCMSMHWARVSVDDTATGSFL